MKKNAGFLFLSFLLIFITAATAQTKPQKQKVRYDTIIVKHITQPAKKAVPKPVAKPVVLQEIILPTPDRVIFTH